MASSPAQVNELLPVCAQAVEVEALGLAAKVVIGVLVPLQDGAEGPARLHRLVQLTQGLMGQQGHSDVVEQALAQCLRGEEMGGKDK